VRSVASPYTRGDAARRAPFLGEDTADVLASICGYDAIRIRALEASGAIPATNLEEDG
jgi:crotonobetainyl-CoA:carnitine CoA-transferase CaiB-like acyl-CoA transferase